MEELCSACLCAGRKLYFINETGFENLYAQIINEIPVDDMRYEVHVRICWECKALLRRLGDFKEQVKRCYTELLAFVHQNTSKPFANYPRLQIKQTHSDCYPTAIKQELEDLSPIDDGPVHHDDEHPGDDDNDGYDVKIEEHCEPETFVNDLNVGKVKKRKIKKDVKPLKIKPKKKLKEKKEVKYSPTKTESRTVGSLIDNLIDSYNKQENGDIPDDKTEKESEVETKEDNRSLQSQNIIVKVVKGMEIKERLPEKPICGECGKTFSSRKTYRYHLNVLHKGQNKFPCPRCGKVYQWKSNLGRHLRSHKARDSDELYCELCDKRFASVATFRQHLRISKRHVSESEFSFMCNECGKKFVNKTRLRDHIDWEHLKKIKFKCQLCNKPFKCHTSLYVHMKNVHRCKDKKDNLCHVCGKSYQNPAKLKYHIIAMHTSETPYQCKQCNAAFGWYSSLYRHVREVHYKMKIYNKKNKKMKKSEVLPSILPVIPQQIILPQLHQGGPNIQS